MVNLRLYAESRPATHGCRPITSRTLAVRPLVPFQDLSAAGGHDRSRCGQVLTAPGPAPPGSRRSERGRGDALPSGHTV